MPEPRRLRAIAFFDGQNLYHAAKAAFGHTYPNYDVLKLATTICTAKGWNLLETRFYTGVPSQEQNPHWHTFWNNKLAFLGKQKVKTIPRPLRHHDRVVPCDRGPDHRFSEGEEKGIDVRIALDVVRLARNNEYDVGLIFSQDQDLKEAAGEVRTVAREDSRWIKLASAFPVGPSTRNRRCIDRTDWIEIDQALYDSCLDMRDYRPKPVHT